jgi:hypothetical protein
MVATITGGDCITGCTSVNMSLNQAIEIHAKVLAHGFGDRAPLLAQERAHHCWALGDREGHAVWLRVAAVAEMLLKEGQKIAHKVVVDRRSSDRTSAPRSAVATDEPSTPASELARRQGAVS